MKVNTYLWVTQVGPQLPVGGHQYSTEEGGNKPSCLCRNPKPLGGGRRKKCWEPLSHQPALGYCSLFVLKIHIEVTHLLSRLASLMLMSCISNLATLITSVYARHYVSRILPFRFADCMCRTAATRLISHLARRVPSDAGLPQPPRHPFYVLHRKLHGHHGEFLLAPPHPFPVPTSTSSSARLVFVSVHPHSDYSEPNPKPPESESPTCQLRRNSSTHPQPTRSRQILMQEVISRVVTIRTKLTRRLKSGRRYMQITR